MVLILVAALLIAACGGGDVDRSGSAPGAGAGAGSTVFTPVTLTGCNGFTSTITSPPRRVLVTSSAEAELLDRLGVSDRLVGMAIPLQPVDLPQSLIEKVKDLPSVYSKEDPYGTPSAESLAAINPDFVVAGFQSFFKNFDKQVLPTQSEYEADRVGSFLLRSSACDENKNPTADDFSADIMALGRVFGAESKATALVDQIKNDADALAQKLAGVQERPTVYLFGYSHSSKSIADNPPGFSGRISTDLIAQAGGVNIFPDEKGYGETSWEVIADKAPQYIGLYDFGKEPDTSKAFYDGGREELLSFAPASSIPAVKNDRIFYLNGDGLVAYNLDTLPAVEAIARALHPDLFR